MFEHCFSYVIYGSENIYWDQIEKNLELISRLPNSACVVFTDDPDRLKDLSDEFDLMLFVVDIPSFLVDFPRLSRFLASCVVDARFYHFRDSDSILTEVEFQIVRFQAVLPLRAVVIRNHTLHFAPILAGLFSLDRAFARELATLVRGAVPKRSPYYDQIFLSSCLYSIIRKDLIVFSSSYFYFGERVCGLLQSEDFCGKPVGYVHSEVVGESFDKLYALFWFPFFHRLLQSPRFVRFYRRIFN